jgi:hypothetical protein
MLPIKKAISIGVNNLQHDIRKLISYNISGNTY